ncbi:MAG: cobalamin biosynthesis protein CobD, partial [Pseudomonadota bacterium]
MWEYVWPVQGYGWGGVAVVIALVVDARWGEPKARWHPVVAMGWCLSRLGDRLAPLATVAEPSSTSDKATLAHLLLWLKG